MTDKNQLDTGLPVTSFNDEDRRYMVRRYKRMIKLLEAGEIHVVIAKLLADISALQPVKDKDVT